MDGLKFRIIREGLGHTIASISNEFNVREVTVRDWEKGNRTIPSPIADRMEKFVDQFADRVGVDQVEGNDRLERALAWANIIDEKLEEE